MTPPHEYRDNSVGIPLPGMATRLTDAGELEIGGPYMARYLEQLDCDDPANAVFNARTDVPWMKTGDLFQVGMAITKSSTASRTSTKTTGVKPLHHAG